MACVSSLRCDFIGRIDLYTKMPRLTSSNEYLTCGGAESLFFRGIFTTISYIYTVKNEGYYYSVGCHSFITVDVMTEVYTKTPI